MKTIDTIMPVTDPVIQEVRRYKLAIAEEFGFDVVALGRSLQERQTCDPRFIMTKANKSLPTGISSTVSTSTTTPNPAADFDVAEKQRPEK